MVADWREDYNERRPHSSLGMTAPASFAKTWREAENGRPITPGGTAQPRRTPQDAPISRAGDRIGPDEPQRAVPRRPVALALGLASRDDEAATLQTPTDHRLSQKVDR